MISCAAVYFKMEAYSQWLLKGFFIFSVMNKKTQTKLSNMRSAV